MTTQNYLQAAWFWQKSFEFKYKCQLTWITVDSMSHIHHHIFYHLSHSNIDYPCDILKWGNIEQRTNLQSIFHVACCMLYVACCMRHWRPCRSLESFHCKVLSLSGSECCFCCPRMPYYDILKGVQSEKTIHLRTEIETIFISLDWVLIQLIGAMNEAKETE